ncbi:carboxymuconolactone decarboxylase family protein [Noviherbaspirillum malthae]|uniref:carboxymuconolactone decarboxylase family protein n=1 Tax=Noviherbaspirillum malthae TaxID=1260987 RepID=UPI00188FB5E4|nr:carboxymuconolactone decarboxylase family protein [Noviherbaspirillum malthae]
MFESADTRLAPSDGPYEPEIAAALKRVMPPGLEPLKLFRVMAHSPRVLQRMFAGSLLDKGPLTLRQRELIILRSCARCNSEYEWGVHVAFFAGKAGLSDSEVSASREQQYSSWTKSEGLLLKLVDELHDDADVSDQLWAALSEEFSTEQLLEMVALAGYYHTISFMTNAFRIGKEDFSPGFDSGASKDLQAATN